MLTFQFDCFYSKHDVFSKYSALASLSDGDEIIPLTRQSVGSDLFRIRSSDDSSVVVLASELFLAASLLLFKAHFLRIRPFTEQSGIKGYRGVTFFQFGKPYCWRVESSRHLITGWIRHVTKNRISPPAEQWKLFFFSFFLFWIMPSLTPPTRRSEVR